LSQQKREALYKMDLKLQQNKSYPIFDLNARIKNLYINFFNGKMVKIVLGIFYTHMRQERKKDNHAYNGSTKIKYSPYQLNFHLTRSKLILLFVH
jgi:hypothetical protein